VLYHSPPLIMMSRVGMIFLLSGAALLAGSADSSGSVDLNQAVADATAALARSDWTAVEGAIRRLSVASVPATLFSAGAGMEHAELLVAMRLYGENRPEEAAQAAAVLIASGRDTAAATQFTFFLNSRRRARTLTPAIGPLICAYAAVLLCSLYLGLRQNLHRLRTS
jgi:hypothetical protein